MARIAYKDPKNLRPETSQLLSEIITVVEDYHSQGFKLTLRQLYYQLVSADIIPNQQKMYAKLSKILSDARMCGQVDWCIIEDRVRVPKMHSQWDDIPDLVDSAIHSYRKDRHYNQENYVEVWVEKDALSGVLAPITDEYHVHLMVNRGYSSVSAMHDAALRFRAAYKQDKECTILYLGDHDPSGLDMIRDIDDRLTGFNADITVRAIALTEKQIEKYNPPPNPAKITDPRAHDYIAQYGKTSWELDALRPNVLHKLLRTNLESLIDMERYNEIVAQENQEKERLVELAEAI
jgi:hypothetical protein